MTNQKVYIIDPVFKDEYKPLLRGVLLVKIDSRLVHGSYVHTYAPIAPNGKFDADNAFEDSFGEVIEYNEAVQALIFMTKIENYLNHVNNRP